MVSRYQSFILLHCLLFVYSLGAVCSKMAGKAEFLSFSFIFYYSLVLLNLFVYAIFWQQILKKIPLVTAFANKAIVVVWGMIWGVFLFQEKISISNVIGMIIIIFGIIMVVKSDERKSDIV